MGADESVDLFAAELPVIVEIGDHCFHEWLAELDRLLLVAQVIEQDGERKLLRASTLVAPLEAEFGESLDLIVLVELPTVDRHDEAIDRALALILAHDSSRDGCAGKTFHIVHQLVTRARRRLGVAFGDRARLIGVQPRTEWQIRRLAIVHVPKTPRQA